MIRLLLSSQLDPWHLLDPFPPFPLLLQLFLVCLVFRSVQLHQSLPSDLLLPPDPLHLVDLGFPVDLVDQLLQSGRLLQSDPLSPVDLGFLVDLVSPLLLSLQLLPSALLLLVVLEFLGDLEDPLLQLDLLLQLLRLVPSNRLPLEFLAVQLGRLDL